MSMITALLAHQGGWDEIALIGGPMILIAGLLVLAKRRVDAAAADQPDDEKADSAPPSDDRA